MTESPIVRLFKKNNATGVNIFHEIAREGTVMLLRRIRDNVDEDIASFLQEPNFRGETCVHIAAGEHRGHLAIEVIDVLVNLGANINAKNNTNETPLHYAVNNKDYELVKWLSKRRDVDLETTNQNHFTPHDMAIIQNALSIVNLLENDDDVNWDSEATDDAGTDDQNVPLQSQYERSKSV
ncbi:uncharacterized protein LOC133524826 [Cydia pomonella]|uniref:uncharacterized protein LOC133524826 n=1 Tax=Cydia pomonella TaxID=82600 RepID=UPI002ADE4F07|nr:uncharacterized protein LOC133524826 [Cydia pomonella]